jgi:lipoate-protein ligase A
MTTWRLLIDGPASPARNMAVDEALLREVSEPVLRIYDWNVPAVSLGYFQPSALAGDRPFIRRYTGGGLVDHAHDVTYTIVLPRTHPWMELSAPDSYCKIHKGVQAALKACGIKSELTPDAAITESEACFQKPVRFDIVAAGSKLSGAAQRRTREGMLHQGSILPPDPKMCEFLRRILPGVFSLHFGFDWAGQMGESPNILTPAEATHAADLERDRYATDTWNNQR